MLNKEYNKNKKYNKNNVYPNRLFSNPNNMKNKELTNNMRVKIPIKENKNKKENIYVNKIKTNKNNNINVSNNKNKEISNNSSFKNCKNMNNLNILNENNFNNKNSIDNKIKKNIENKHKNNSTKNIYIPKKATSFRGISQENTPNLKRKNMSPVYHKKIDNEKFTNTNNINTKKEKNKYFNYFNSEKRLNNKNNKYEYNPYINNNGRATYSRKYSLKKQNYCWQNNNSCDNKINIKDFNYIENKNIIGGNNKDNIDINDIFDNEINDISSIKINTSYDSCTMDYESNLNRFKFSIVDNEYNNKTDKKNNLIYIHKFKNNGGNIDSNNNIQNINHKSEIDKNIKTKKYSGITIQNKNDLYCENVYINNKLKFDKKESSDKNLSNK